MTIAAAFWLSSFYFALILALTLSIARGGGPERIAATLFVSATAVSLLARSHGTPFAGVEIPLAVIDLWVLVTLWLISLFANRWWPMMAFGAQLVSSTAHLVKALDPSLGPSVYSRMEFLSSWPTVLVLSVPMIWRTKRHDVVATWQPSLPLAVRKTLMKLRLD